VNNLGDMDAVLLAILRLPSVLNMLIMLGEVDAILLIKSRLNVLLRVVLGHAVLLG